jgi:PhnB protein
MSLNTSQKRWNMQTTVPMLAYEDASAAIDFLTNAFGFSEKMRMQSPDGSIGHAELGLNGGVVMLATPSPDYHSPRHHREECAQAAKWSQVPYIIDGVYVQVPDVDAHFAQAKKAGATILSEPQDQSYGERNYRAEDQEGHRWMFATPTQGA